MQIRRGIFPRSRHEGIVVEELGDELLIYDTTNDRAHTLNRTAALVWKLCDGKRTVGEIALAAGNELQQPISEQIVMYALAKLADYQLLEESVAMPSAVVSRREFLTKFAVAAAVVPVVKTLKVQALDITPVSCGGELHSCPAPPCCPGLECCATTNTCLLDTACPS